MIAKEQWEAMSAEQQANAWWVELSAMIDQAMSGLQYLPANPKTAVVSGLTTIVAEQ